jgi:hypothetical protein
VPHVRTLVIGAGDNQTLDSTPKSPKPIVTQGPLASTGVNKPHIHVGSVLYRIEILFFEFVVGRSLRCNCTPVINRQLKAVVDA